jgi:hypothetical protein
VLALALALSGLLAPAPPAQALATAPSVGDGPAPCSSGPPPDPLHGWCGTYGGANTFYGTYGPGFPTATGWGLCAWAPATGGWYPVPGYSYVLSDPPDGITMTYLDALGFAFSEGLLQGYWGQTLAWGPDDAAVAAKLYYDTLAWQRPLPAMSGGVANAFAALYSATLAAAVGGGEPQLSASLPGGATSFTTSTTVTVRLAFPASGQPLAGVPLSFTLTNATFDADHAANISATTAADGTVSLPITASSAPATVTMTSSGQIGTRGIDFYRPSDPAAQDAQELASPDSATPIERTDTWTSLAPPPQTGRIAIDKTGDDTPYLSIEGAEFEILSGATVVDTLDTDATGHAGPSPKLVVGSYTLHESQPPDGYLPVPDRTVVVSANSTTVVDLSGANGDSAITASLSLRKVDDVSGAPLAGAVFELARDPDHTGSWVDIGSCTTSASGDCAPPGAGALLPGYYRVTETSPPPGYQLSPAGAVQYIELAPGQVATLTFGDDRILTTLYIEKANSLEPDQGVPGAIYELYVDGTPPASAPPSAPLGVSVPTGLHYYARGQTDAGGHLGFTIPVGFRWCVKEEHSPPGFVLDTAVRCTAVITQSSPDPVRTVAELEQPSLVTISASKFNAAAPGELIEGATYALFVVGSFPEGFTPPTPPPSLAVPAGDELWALQSTDALGQLHFSVPSGHAWCLAEEQVPAGYVLDTGLHCTARLTRSSPASETSIALPEVALAELAFTGAPLGSIGLIAALALAGGLVLVRRARKPAR